jgi:hypothetical protein
MQPHDSDEILVHVKGWGEMLRYATHSRGGSWNPPLVSLQTSQLRELAWELKPTEYAAYLVTIGEYAAAPLLNDGAEWGPTMRAQTHRGARRLPLERLVKALQTSGMTQARHARAAIDSLNHAGLLDFSTVDGRSVDGRVLVLNSD